MTEALAVREASAIAEQVRPSSGLALSFAEMTMRVAQLDQFYREVMQEGTDYGVIPGTAKPSLFQPGAQLLDQIFGYTPTFEVAPSSRIDWDRPIPFFHYIVVCRLISRRSGEVVAEGIGSCNSHEDKYRWRQGEKVCPKCGIAAIRRSKQEYGGGYFCNAKQGGCGGRFRSNTKEASDLDAQQDGRVENQDTASLENTISKMAQKRAHIAATLNATGASRIFTQDIEDLPQFQQALRVDVQVKAVEPNEEPPERPAPQTVGHVAQERARAKRVIEGDVVTKDNDPPDPARSRPIRQSRSAMVKSLGYRMQHARQLGLDPAEQDTDGLSDEQLAAVLGALTEQIQLAQAQRAPADDEAF